MSGDTAARMRRGRHPRSSAGLNTSVQPDFDHCDNGQVGFTLMLSPWSPNRVMLRPHLHDTLEINFVRQGHGRYFVGGLCFPIERHTVFVIPAGLPHQTVADPEDPHWHLTVYFSPAALAPLGPVALQHAEVVARQQMCLPAGGFAGLWERLFDGLQAEYEHAAGPGAPTAAAKLLDACLLVRRCAAATVLPAARPLAHSTRRQHVRDVLAYLDDHPGEPPSLRRIAAYVGLDPSYVSTVFREETGVTLFAHINARRLQQARALLAAGSMSVDEVARTCGFGSVSGLYRRVRAAYGTTPARLRQT